MLRAAGGILSPPSGTTLPMPTVQTFPSVNVSRWQWFHDLSPALSPAGCAAEASASELNFAEWKSISPISYAFEG